MKTLIKLLAFVAISLFAIERSEAVPIIVGDVTYEADTFTKTPDQKWDEVISEIQAQPWFGDANLAYAFVQAFIANLSFNTNTDVYFVTGIFTLNDQYRMNGYQWKTDSTFLDDKTTGNGWHMNNVNDHFARVQRVPDSGSSIAMVFVGMATLLIFSIKQNRRKVAVKIHR